MHNCVCHRCDYVSEPVVELCKGWTDMVITSVVCLNVGSKVKILGLDHASLNTVQVKTCGELC